MGKEEIATVSDANTDENIAETNSGESESQIIPAEGKNEEESIQMENDLTSENEPEKVETTENQSTIVSEEESIVALTVSQEKTHDEQATDCEDDSNDVPAQIQNTLETS